MAMPSHLNPRCYAWKRRAHEELVGGLQAWLQLGCGRWVACLPLEDLDIGKPPTPSQALRNGEPTARVLRQCPN